MSDTPQLSESEWEIMKVLWADSPLSAYDITQALHGSRKWHPNTVRTMLSRLTRKKALKANKYKNLFLYEPTFTEEECIATESKSFLERVFGGSVKPLLVHFAKNEEIDAEDIRELKRILDQGNK